MQIVRKVIVKGEEISIFDHLKREHDHALRSGIYKKARFHGSFGDFCFLKGCGLSIEKATVYNYDKLIFGIGYLKNLKILSIEFPNKDIFTYDIFPKLKMLEAPWVRDEQGISALSHLSIIDLRLDHVPKHIDPIQNGIIEDMTLYAPKIEDLKVISGFSVLDSLRIEKARTLKTLHGLPQSLTSLLIGYTKSIADYSRLIDLPGLKILAITKSLENQDLPNSIYSIPHLEHLGVSMGPVSVNWNKLLEMPKLNSMAFHLSSPPPSREILDQIARENGKIVNEMKVTGVKKRPVVTIKLDSL